MPRNISFALTTEQIRNRTKTVTRRLGWKDLKPGTVLMACEKCQGIKKGELVRLGLIRVVSVRQESLLKLMRDESYGQLEATREGFPHLNGEQFVAMFCDHMRPLFGCVTEVTRIEFEYVEPSVN